MKQTLWLFGDSFADPHYPNHDITYHYKLEKHFEVENFAYGGTGPEWSLQQFLSADKKIPHDEKKNINILFLASHWARFNIKIIDHGNQDSISKLASPSGPTHKIAPIMKRIFINQFFKEYAFHNNTFILHNMLLVKHYARDYKKCIYWPIFDLIEDKVRELYHSKNFYIQDYLLSDYHDPSEDEETSRCANHMNEKSHDKVYEELLVLFNETF